MPHMKLSLSKRTAVWLTVLSIVGLSVGAYVEYERIHTAKDDLRLLPPAQPPYHLKSPFWLFDRYYRFKMPDDLVIKGKLPAFEEDQYVLAFNLKKFLLLCLASSAVIWSTCLSSAWFLSGLRGRKS